MYSSRQVLGAVLEKGMFSDKEKKMLSVMKVVFVISVLLSLTGVSTSSNVTTPSSHPTDKEAIPTVNGNANDTTTALKEPFAGVTNETEIGTTVADGSTVLPNMDENVNATVTVSEEPFREVIDVTEIGTTVADGSTVSPKADETVNTANVSEVPFRVTNEAEIGTPLGDDSTVTAAAPTATEGPSPGVSTTSLLPGVTSLRGVIATTSGDDGSTEMLTLNGTTSSAREEPLGQVTSETATLTEGSDGSTLTMEGKDTDKESDSALTTSLPMLDGDITTFTSGADGVTTAVEQFITPSIDMGEKTSQVGVMGTTQLPVLDGDITTFTSGEDVDVITTAVEHIVTPSIEIGEKTSQVGVMGTTQLPVLDDDITIFATREDIDVITTAVEHIVTPSIEIGEKTSQVGVMGTTQLPVLDDDITIFATREEDIDVITTAVEHIVTPSIDIGEKTSQVGVMGTTQLPVLDDDVTIFTTREDTGVITTAVEHIVTPSIEIDEIISTTIAGIDVGDITTAVEQIVTTTKESVDEIGTAVETLGTTLSDIEDVSTPAMEIKIGTTTEGTTEVGRPPAVVTRATPKVTTPSPSMALPSTTFITTHVLSTIPLTTSTSTPSPLPPSPSIPSSSPPPLVSSTPTTVPSTTVKVPSTTTKVPTTTAKVPSTTVKVPSTTTKVPTTTAKVPSTTVKVPSTTTKVPTATAKDRKVELDSKVYGKNIVSVEFKVKNVKSGRKERSSDQHSKVDQDEEVVASWYRHYDADFRSEIAKAAREVTKRDDKPQADDVMYVSPTPEVRGDFLAISVVVESPDGAEGVEKYMAAAALKKAIEDQGTLEKTTQLEYEAIYVGPAKAEKDKSTSKDGTLFEHPIILVILLLVAFLCLIIIIIGMMYLLCDKHLSSRRGEYITNLSTVNDSEMGYDNPVMQEKDPANGAHLLGIRTDAEGQDIAPLECFPAEELHRNYEVEDTHL